MTQTPTPVDATLDRYALAPTLPVEMSSDLKPYAQSILDMDVVRSVPGNVKIDSSGLAPMQLKMDGLSPVMRSEVFRKLERLPKMDALDRAKYEESYVREAVESKLAGIRVKSGLGPDALPYHREAAEIAGRVKDLHRKRDILQEDIDRIARYDMIDDPVTGVPNPTPVYALPEYRRNAYAEQVADYDRQARLLVDPSGKYGIQGSKQINAALVKSAQMLQQLEVNRADERDAQALAVDMVRKERVQKRAETIASIRRASSL